MADRLLLVGQAARTSGYARVLRGLAAPLASSYQTHYFTVNTRQPVAGLPGVGQHQPLRRSDPYGFAELPRLLRDLAPDVLLACHDAAYLAEYVRIVRAHAPATRVVCYVALEWDSISPRTEDGLRQADQLVCYTEVARSWLARRWRDRDHPPLSVLPHGVDLDVFGPVDATGAVVPDTPRASARAHARALLGLGEAGEFLVVNANRDSERKRLDRTVRAFAQLAERVRDARLVLVHGARLRALADRLGIGDRLVVPAETPDDRTLNLYLNAADVGVNTSMGEGWGLLAFEHGASRVAQLMPAHPSCVENWAGNAVLLDRADSPIDGHGEVSVADCARRLAELSHDRGSLAHWDTRAAAVARDDRFGWPRIADRWRTRLSPADHHHPDSPERTNLGQARTRAVASATLPPAISGPRHTGRPGHRR